MSYHGDGLPGRRQEQPPMETWGGARAAHRRLCYAPAGPGDERVGQSRQGPGSTHAPPDAPSLDSHERMEYKGCATRSMPLTHQVGYNPRSESGAVPVPRGCGVRPGVLVLLSGRRRTTTAQGPRLDGGAPYHDVAIPRLRPATCRASLTATGHTAEAARAHLHGAGA